MFQAEVAERDAIYVPSLLIVVWISVQFLPKAMSESQLS